MVKLASTKVHYLRRYMRDCSQQKSDFVQDSAMINIPGHVESLQIKLTLKYLT